VSRRYLLPCRCGQQSVVEPQRAGETIVCSCGAAMQIPTMLEMAALEEAPEPAAAPVAATAWGLRPALLFLGSVLLVAAVGWGMYLYGFLRPTPPIDAIDPEQIRQSAKLLTPKETWNIWEGMKQGLDRRVDKGYADALARYQGLLAVDAVLALVGAASLVAGAAVGRQGDKEIRRGGDRERGRRGDITRSK
jgi:hypothetical protein